MNEEREGDMESMLWQLLLFSLLHLPERSDRTGRMSEMRAFKKFNTYLLSTPLYQFLCQALKIKQWVRGTWTLHSKRHRH